MIADASGPHAVDLLDRAAAAFRGVGGASHDFAHTDGALAFVAVEDDEIQGWCWGHVLPRPDGKTMAHLHDLVVAEGHRRRGIARQLVRAFAASAGRRGATTMFLTTGEGNLAARALYDSLGGGLAAQGPTVQYWFPLPLGTSG